MVRARPGELDREDRRQPEIEDRHARVLHLRASARQVGDAFVNTALDPRRVAVHEMVIDNADAQAFDALA